MRSFSVIWWFILTVLFLILFTFLPAKERYRHPSLLTILMGLEEREHRALHTTEVPARTVSSHLWYAKHLDFHDLTRRSHGLIHKN